LEQIVQMYFVLDIPAVRLEIWDQDSTLELNQTLNLSVQYQGDIDNFLHSNPHMSPNFPDWDQKLKTALGLFQQVNFRSHRPQHCYIPQVGTLHKFWLQPNNDNTCSED